MRDRRSTRLILALLAATSLIFIIVDVRTNDSSPLTPLRSVADAIFGPLQSAASAITSPLGNLFGSIGSDSQAKAEELQQENDRLTSELAVSGAYKARAEELDALLRISSQGQYTTIPAQVVAVGPAQGFSWTVTIDAGERDGVQVDMSVINGAGLVGRVVSVGADYSTVLLIVDATSTVGGRLAETREVGLVNGTGRQDVVDFQVLDPTSSLKEGEALVTFGSSGGRPYAPGIPIGRIVSVSGGPGQLTQTATVQPFADISALDLVGVVVEAPRADPRTPITPEPMPSPTSTPTDGPASPSATQSSTPTATAP